MRKTALSMSMALLLSSNAVAESFNTLDIAVRGASEQCLDWCITGVCFWLVCSPFPPSCWIETTPQISHNLPDLVTSVYEQPGDLPWTEMKHTLGKLTGSTLSAAAKALLGYEPDGGTYLEGSLQSTSHLRFKEASVIGNPVTEITSQFPFLCKSKVDPLFPYFASELDALPWRSGLPDSLTLEAITPGLREIGPDAFRTWGSVYPRSGFVNQSDDTRAAAVIAQRAIDVVTREGQPHVYVPYGHDGPKEMVWGDRWAQTKEDCQKEGGRWKEISDNIWQCREQRSVQWMPGSNEKTDQWQMISPVSDQSCGPFGDPDDWEDRQSNDGRYAWLYWRPYQCCIPGPGKFLTSISIPKVCL